jgi:hypothetical protein
VGLAVVSLEPGSSERAAASLPCAGSRVPASLTADAVGGDLCSEWRGEEIGASAHWKGK